MHTFINYKTITVVIFAQLLCLCVGCNSSVSDEQKIAQQEDGKALGDTIVKFYEDLDEFTLQGINELKRSELSYPYIKLYYLKNKLQKFTAYWKKSSLETKINYNKNNKPYSINIHSSDPESTETIYGDTICSLHFYSPEDSSFLMRIFFATKDTAREIIFDGFDIPYDEYKNADNIWQLIEKHKAQISKDSISMSGIADRFFTNHIVMHRNL